MRKFWKFSFYIFLAIIFCGVFYYVYQVLWNGIDVRSVFAKGWSAAGITAQKAGDFLKEKTGRTVNYVASGGVQYARQGAGTALSSLGQGLTSLGSGIVGETSYGSSSLPTTQTGGGSGGTVLSITSGTVNVPATDGFLSPAPFSAIAARSGESISFSLNRESSFRVLWGDNNEDHGIVPKDKSVILSHSWTRRGDYTVLFSITEQDRTKDFSFPVRIYE